MDSLTLIGYWRNNQHPELPDPADFIDPTWDGDERFTVGSYLTSGLIARAYMGVSFCRLCGRPNGNLEYSDGTYLWPEGLKHYVQEHDVRLPSEVVEHAIRQLEWLETTDVDDEWWQEITAPPAS